ncbi:uncharacterized protein LOC132751892 [Ruditapes philippinarum]|uniref:uncharacterized protein LOC132751892 n=1 Tax=Ruditapes philippinarum TaxID=129788 RepID=UPI00295A794E|nr:uncharacterized protein LOC132751892 [Ruditapes philippinarum]XP_060598090.1 uncharacterized protein LOC132751892 [Ruditapes philippinarum]
MDIDPDAETINITSGVLHAVLHRHRFICPGINRECIEFQGQFITPKTFYVMADKGSLKDWKNAIRINGKKIRRYLDTGELEFYNHAELCTGRCKSKMGNKTAANISVTDSLNSSLLSPALSKRTTSNGLKSSVFFDNEQYSSNDSLNLMKEVDSFGDAVDVKPDVEQLRLLNVLNLRQNSDGTSSSGDQAMPMQIVQVSTNGQEEDDEDAMFWRAIVQLGLIDEFFREVKSKLDVLKASMIKNYVPVGDAKKASRIVNELGMRSKLDMRLCAHKFEFDRQRDKLEKEMEQLKKKVSEYEQRKEVLKQKSNTYDQLMTKKIKLEDMSTSEMQPKSKNLFLEGLKPDLTQYVVQQSPNNNMIMMLNPGKQCKEGSPKLNDTSINDSQHQAKRARIESILGQFPIHSAIEPVGASTRSQKSKSESPKLLEGTKQQKGKQTSLEGMSIEVNNENSLESLSGSPASQESFEADQSEDHSLVTQSQVSSLETLSQESISESPISTE